VVLGLEPVAEHDLDDLVRRRRVPVAARRESAELDLGVQHRDERIPVLVDETADERPPELGGFHDRRR
jgi:hypothetical protein